MNYEISLDDKLGVVKLKVINMLTAEDVHQFMPLAIEYFNQMKNQCVLIDTSPGPAGVLDQSARKAFREYAERLKKVDKIAIYGAKPTVRMMARAAAAAIGRLKVTVFFQTEQEALDWLRQ